MQRPFKIGKKDSTIKINIIILNGLSEGITTKEMAKQLNISERGVRGRIERLRENNLCENTIHLVGRYAQERVNEKDLIIKGIEEGSELWKAEYDNCRAILTELVYLKTLKDSKGKTEEYNQRQPLVWIAAKKFLEKYQHGQY